MKHSYMKFAVGLVGCLIMLLVVIIWPYKYEEKEKSVERYPFKIWNVSSLQEAVQINNYILAYRQLIMDGKALYRDDIMSHYQIKYIFNLDLTCSGEKSHLEYPQVYQSWKNQYIDPTYEKVKQGWRGVDHTTSVVYRDW